jgi:hypothetical protein
VDIADPALGGPGEEVGGVGGGDGSDIHPHGTRREGQRVCTHHNVADGVRAKQHRQNDGCIVDCRLWCGRGGRSARNDPVGGGTRAVPHGEFVAGGQKVDGEFVAHASDAEHCNLGHSYFLWCAPNGTA